MRGNIGVIMRILVINPNTSVDTTERIRLAAERTASDGTIIETVTAPYGEKVIKTLENSARAGEAVMSLLAERASPVDAAVIAAYSDPGLQQAKATYPYPAVGIGEASMLEAAAVSDRFSIVTMGRPMVGYLRERAIEYGVSDKLAGVRILPWSVRAGRPSDVDDLTAECIAAIQHDGAGAVIIGGGPLAGFAEEISRAVMKPVLDGIVCAVRLAERMVRERREKFAN